LATFDIDEEAGPDAEQPTPCLDVVPSGQSRSRAEVFRALGLEDGRVRNYRHIPGFHVIILEWQVSPSYAISCMTAANDPDNAGLGLTDPQRKVYGVRLFKRPE
jgi:hypothetical protein